MFYWLPSCDIILFVQLVTVFIRFRSMALVSSMFQIQIHQYQYIINIRRIMYFVIDLITLFVLLFYPTHEIDPPFIKSNNLNPLFVFSDTFSPYPL